MIRIIADSHNGYNWKEQQNVFDFLKLTHDGDVTISVGDTDEYAWLGPMMFNNEIVKAFHRKIMGELIMLYGNHDCPEMCSAESYSFGTLDSLGVIMHGHQFDSTCDRAWKREIYNLGPVVRKFWFKSPFQQKTNNHGKWMDHNARIWGNAIKWLEDSCFSTLVMGHTHDSRIISSPETGKTLIALGSIAEDGVYAILHDNGYVEIEHI